MPFTDEKFYAPAKNSDVAAVAIKAARAIGAINMALMKIRAGENFDDEIKKISEIAVEMDAIFDELTGYYSGE